MHKITNRTGAPFDIVTTSGPAVLPAFGSITGSFDPSYLAVLEAGGAVTIEAVKPAPRKTRR